MADAFKDHYHAIHGADEARFSGKPHGWIQWKGTQACIDMHCMCGAHGHMDAEFLYYYACAACGRKYALGSHIPLMELTAEQAQYVERETMGFKTDKSVLEDEGL